MINSMHVQILWCWQKVSLMGMPLKPLKYRCFVHNGKLSSELLGGAELLQQKALKQCVSPFAIPVQLQSSMSALQRQRLQVKACTHPSVQLPSR